MKDKELGIAGALNIIPGLGYQYVGTRKLFGRLLMIGLAMMLIGVNGSTDAVVTSTPTNNDDLSKWDILVVGGVLVWVAAFIIDSYQEAKRVNKEQS